MKIVEFNCLENLENCRNGESLAEETVIATFKGEYKKHIVYGLLRVLSWDSLTFQYLADCEYKGIAYNASEIILSLDTEWLTEKGIRESILKTFGKEGFDIIEAQIDEMFNAHPKASISDIQNLLSSKYGALDCQTNDQEDHFMKQLLALTNEIIKEMYGE